MIVTAVRDVAVTRCWLCRFPRALAEKEVMCIAVTASEIAG